MILANQDMHGFNDGVTFFRVSHELVSFLSQVLVISHDITALWHLGTGGEGPPSDQRALALALLADSKVQEGFYEIPMRWMNAYTLPGDEDDEGEGYVPHGQVHLVAWAKYQWDYSMILELAEEVYERAQVETWEMGEEGNGLGPNEERERVRAAAEEWWSVAKSGIEGMVFSGV